MTVLAFDKFQITGTSNPTAGRNTYPLDLGDRGNFFCVDGNRIYRGTDLEAGTAGTFTEVSQSGGGGTGGRIPVDDETTSGWNWLNGSLWFATYKGTTSRLWQGTVNAGGTSVSWTRRGNLTVTANNPRYIGTCRIYRQSSSIIHVVYGIGDPTRSAVGTNLAQRGSNIYARFAWNGSAYRRVGSGSAGVEAIMLTTGGQGQTLQVISSRIVTYTSQQPRQQAGVYNASSGTFQLDSNAVSATYVPWGVTRRASDRGYWNSFLDTGADVWGLAVSNELIDDLNNPNAGFFGSPGHGIGLFKAATRGDYTNPITFSFQTKKFLPATIPVVPLSTSAAGTSKSPAAASYMAWLPASGEIVLVVWSYESIGGSNNRQPIWLDTFDPVTATWESGSTGWQTLETSAWNNEETIQRVMLPSFFPADTAIIHVASNRRNYAYRVVGNRAPYEVSLSVSQDGRDGDFGPGRVVSAKLKLDWLFQDYESDGQGAYRLRREIGNQTRYWTGTVWSATPQKITSVFSEVELPANWGTAGSTAQRYSVQLWDEHDTGPSPWSNGVIVNPAGIVNPTLTAPSGTQRLDVANVTWTVSSQSRYRVRVFAANSDGTIDRSSVAYDSNVFTSTEKTTQVPLPDNNTTYWISLITWSESGVQSAERTRKVTTDWYPPNKPTLTVRPDDVNKSLRVTARTTFGGSASAPHSVEIERRGGDLGAFHIATGSVSGNPRVGTFNDYHVAGAVDYEYRARALAGSAVYGAWSSWT